ncbi:hypothetical protein GW750_08435 [bacterium]|nr:hypothetical protein [bacterium]
MSNENYILVKEVSPSNQYYFVLSGAPAADFDIAQYDPGIDDQYTLCFGTGQGWYACP